MSVQAAAPAARTAEDVEAELASLEGIRPREEEEDEEILPPDPVLVRSESEAGRQGWVPKHLYKGDPSKWVDAQTFIQRGERFTNNLQREVAELRRKLEEFEGTKKAFTKFHEETIAAKDAEISSTIRQLRVQRSEASRNGEDELAVSIEDQIDVLKSRQVELKAPQGEVAAPASATADPVTNLVLQEWVEDGNAWFQDEPQLRSYAIALGDALVKNGETARGRAFLDIVTEQMRADFPRKFKQKQQSARGSEVESGSAGGRGAPAGGTERDLPAEDLALMKQFIREGWTTKEKFLKSYFSSTRK